MEYKNTAFQAMAKTVLTLAAVAALSAGAYIYRDKLFPAAPCSRPLTYSIGEFDGQFEKSREQFLKDISAATKVWSSSVGKELFAYSAEKSDLTVNLIYDYRQKATIEMRSLGISIDSSASTTDSIKIKYDALVRSYKESKAVLDKKISALSAARSAYEEEVRKWNSQGGAPKDRFEALKQERVSINNEVASTNALQKTINALVDDINATATILNRLVKQHNTDVASYNTIGSTTGAEFGEGEYVIGASGTSINIYQYADNIKLMRVLAHEFGHALGMDHVDGPDAIMYKLNESSNEKATAADIAELKKVCDL